jgi:hypothetical protein
LMPFDKLASLPLMQQSYFFASSNATDIPKIIQAASNRFSLQRHVQQVVAVPLFASFPVYDFFVLHRTNTGWRVAAGYQCKQGSNYPEEDADEAVSMSVFLEGRCRKYIGLKRLANDWTGRNRRAGYC